MQATIGIIGNGFVGGAVSYGFITRGAYVKVYDKDANRRLDSMKSVLGCNFVFVCLPTPMLSAEGDDADLSILIEFFDGVVSEEDFNPIYVIKSTVPVGPTEMISSLHKDLNVVHNPEFLTASNARRDFINAERTVIGGKNSLADAVENVYSQYFPEIPSIKMASSASELVKYTANSFLALKVSYFNMIFEFAEKSKINFYDVISGVSSDSRIGESHCSVPGPDGDFGYGGTCFPKDVNAMIKMLDRQDIYSRILEASWHYNKKRRKHWDWAESPSAVSQKQ
jgi:UDPglucose 6-dehydrogenase